MAKKTHVSPGSLTRLQARIGMVVAALFLVFGLIFAYAVNQDTPDSETGLRLVQLAFLVLWIFVCVGLMVTSWRVISRGDNPAETSILDIETSNDNDDGNDSSDFARRLRDLEALKRDGLITEAEYHRKRDDILAEKW